jgi:molybdate transport system ATP-binding protein
MITVAIRHHFPELDIDIAFAAPTPGVTVLFGPSGSGKSTVISAISGLLRADNCHVSFDGEVLADSGHRVWVAPERRRIGLVFQDARLFPHMSVQANLRYGMRRAAPGPIRFDDVVELLGIGHLLDRSPHTLSGGEKQRVGIGRALLSQPRLLLLDEPLASLDDARRADILPFLLKLKTSLSLPMLYVTHSLAELSMLADHVVLLEAGKLHASGSLAEIAADASLKLAARDDAGTALELAVIDHDPARELTRIGNADVSFQVPLLDRPAGSRIRVRIPAREIILAGEKPRSISVHNALEGTVRRVVEDRPRRAAMVEVLVGDTALLARVTPDAVGRLALVPGAPVVALVKSTSVDVLGATAGC